MTVLVALVDQRPVQANRRSRVEAARRSTVATFTPSTYTPATPRAGASRVIHAKERPVNVTLAVAPAWVDVLAEPPHQALPDVLVQEPRQRTSEEDCCTPARRKLGPVTQAAQLPARSIARTVQR